MQSDKTQEKQKKEETQKTQKKTVAGTKPRNVEDIDYLEVRNLCTECGVDMGISNPRQLCGKYVCRNLV